jgi:SOS response regulatory protein OraA/RecX
VRGGGPGEHRPGGSSLSGTASGSVEERLARAAAALAEAEGVAATRSRSGGGTSGWSGGSGWSSGSENGGSAGGGRSGSTSRPGGSGRRGQGGRAGRSGRAGAAGEAGSGLDGVVDASDAPDTSDEVEGAPDGGRRRRGRAGRSAPPDDPQTASDDADPESVARSIALRQLSMAPRSRAQLEKKLSQRGCDDDVAARVLDRLTEVGLVDDGAYAEMLVRSRHAGKGLARRAIAHELREKGIDRDLADEALEQVDTDDERARAEELVARRLRSLHGLAPEVQARRLAGMLARKGYSGDVAWAVVRRAVDEAPEHQRD